MRKLLLLSSSLGRAFALETIKCGNIVEKNDGIYEEKKNNGRRVLCAIEGSETYRWIQERP